MEPTDKLYTVSIEITEDHLMNYQGMIIDEMVYAPNIEISVDRIIAMYDLNRNKMRVLHKELYKE